MTSTTTVDVFTFTDSADARVSQRLQYDFSKLDMGRLRDRARELEERRRGMKVGPNVMTMIDTYVLALGRPTGSWVSV